MTWGDEKCFFLIFCNDYFCYAFPFKAHHQEIKCTVNNEIVSSATLTKTYF